MKLKILKCSLPAKFTQHLIAGLHEIAISKKAKSVWYILTILSEKHNYLPLIIKIFKKFYLKIKSLKILKCSLF